MSSVQWHDHIGQKAAFLFVLPLLGMLLGWETRADGADIAGPSLPTSLVKAGYTTSFVDGREVLVVDDMIFPVNRMAKSGFRIRQWIDGRVYYVFDENLDDLDGRPFEGDGESRRENWRAAAAEWARGVPGLMFIEGEGDGDYILVRSSDSNSSYIGMAGDRQTMNIFNWNWRFIMAHEIGHAIGLIHEQSRIDRDTFVIVRYGNILDDREFNYDIQEASIPHGNYDYGSVMHYGRCTFAIDGSDCYPNFTMDATAAGATAIGLTQEQANKAMGQRFRVTSGDISAARYLYPSHSLKFFGVKVVEFDGVQDLVFPREAEVSPEGKHLYVLSTNWDLRSLVAFERSPADGSLDFVQSITPTDLPSLSGAASATHQKFTFVEPPWCDLVVSPEGQNVYVVGLEYGAVTVFSRDQDSGELTFLERQTGWGGGMGRYPTSLEISPDGSHVYVNDDVWLDGSWASSLSLFSRDSSDGKLTFLKQYTNNWQGVEGIAGVRSLEISLDGGFLFAAGYSDHAVVSFSRDPGSGELNFVEAEFQPLGNDPAVEGPVDLAVSPDGKNLYVSFEEPVVAVFSVDQTTGSMTYLQPLIDNYDGIAGGPHLLFPMGICVSPDGEEVYVTAAGDDALSVFAREGGRGLLTLVEDHVDGENGVDGLDAATSVACSPDGQNVYVTGWLDSSTAIFSKEAPPVFSDGFESSNSYLWSSVVP